MYLSPTSAGSGGAFTDLVDQPYSAGGYSSTYHRWASHIDPSRPIGMLIHLHGDGAFEYDNPVSPYCLGGPDGIVAQARVRNLIVIVPLTPDDDTRTWWNWSGTASNTQWLDALQTAILDAFDVDLGRLWYTAFSGGSQFLTKYYLPRFANNAAGGGAVVFGGGNAPDTAVTPVDAGTRSRFTMHWLTGGDDVAANAADGFDGLAAAVGGERWYRDAGFVTTLVTPPGHGHDWPNEFGPRCGEIFAAYL
ncbi:hypothetical protein [Rhodococcus kronopolitis]|uniref:Esterase n=1 Tax=Rhodococcus kronopolitis TaxID=1460226 RepID=A0ABV9FXK6_9NOCA